MDLYTTRPVSSINALSKPEAGLRPFQRVTAQVLDVTGTTVLLSVDGQPIVAQLTSPEQAKILLGQQTAQFIVTQLSDQKITLKMLKGADTETTDVASPSKGTELAMRLLEQNDIPTTINNLMMARSVLKQHLPVSRALLNELMQALSDYGIWGSREAAIAASLKAAGLPVTAESIGLASHQPDKTSNSISQLIKSLNDLADPEISADILKQLELNMWLLNGLILDADEEAGQLAEQLKAAMAALGRSFENILLEQTQNPDTTFSEINLLSLAQLQKLLEREGKHQASETISEFLKDIRSDQFRNAKSEWVEINIPIQNAKMDQGFSSARLRIARDAKSNLEKINADSTRLILQIDINPNETVEVDLAMIGKQIRAAVTAPNPLWGEQAENELPSLEATLEGLGFILREAKVSTAEMQPLAELNRPSDADLLMAVDIEV